MSITCIDGLKVKCLIWFIGVPDIFSRADFYQSTRKTSVFSHYFFVAAAAASQFSESRQGQAYGHAGPWSQNWTTNLDQRFTRVRMAVVVCCNFDRSSLAHFLAINAETLVREKFSFFFVNKAGKI